MTTQNLVLGGDPDHWDQAIYAFLAEKQRRSGSIRTVRGAKVAQTNRTKRVAASRRWQRPRNQVSTAR